MTDHQGGPEEGNEMLTERQTERLLDKLCVDMGFCLPPDAQRRLIADPPAEVESFVDAVFIAEGLNPVIADRHLHRQVQAVVAEAFRKSEEAREHRDSRE